MKKHKKNGTIGTGIVIKSRSGGMVDALDSKSSLVRGGGSSPLSGTMKSLPLSYIEISKSKLLHNIKQFRRIVKKGTKIAAVIKANAYGHGDKEVIKIVNPHIDYFQINSIEELEKIKPYTKKEILLLGYIGENDIEQAIKLGCILSVFDLHHALLINKIAKKLKTKQMVLIAIDSHLGREGILPLHTALFLKEIKKMKNISIDGVYAHFANIEDTSDFSHAEKQIRDYEYVVKIFKENGYSKIKTHISATSGVLAYEKGRGINTIVRVGIGLYGMWPSTELANAWQKKLVLLPVVRWITHIAQVKIVPKGESIGYGLSYITKKETKLAIIPQGYSNGLSRSYAHKGEILIKGKRAPILGRIAMNMFVVDVTDIKGVKPENEVILLGSQKKEKITAEDIANKIATINYEVTTQISPLLPKIIK